MRIGFDLDGVLADLNAALVREAQRRFPGVETAAGGPADCSQAPSAPDPALEGDDPAESVPASLMLSRRQERQLWGTVTSTVNFWETLTETEPGIVRRLADVARARRWEVIFLTSRPRSAGDVVQVQTQRWLERLGYPLPSVFVVSASRGKIAAALELDVVVDDRPENCLDIAIDSKARAILIWRGDAGGVPGSARRLGIGGVGSVAACLDLLEQADRPGEDAGLVDRLMRLLRLKPSTEQAKA
jgi:hypothetical protein